MREADAGLPGELDDARAADDHDPLVEVGAFEQGEAFGGGLDVRGDGVESPLAVAAVEAPDLEGFGGDEVRNRRSRGSRGRWAGCWVRVGAGRGGVRHRSLHRAMTNRQ